MIGHFQFNIKTYYVKNYVQLFPFDILAQIFKMLYHENKNLWYF